MKDTITNAALMALSLALFPFILAGEVLYSFIAGRSRLSQCWLGLHRWDMPGGHCEKCGKCDEFFGPHKECKNV